MTSPLSDIRNIANYTQLMNKSIIDKMFFIDKIDANFIVDFGCADGALVKSLALLFGDSLIYRGYDLNQNMITRAEENTKDLPVDLRFSSSFSELIEEQKDHQSVLVLSSVIHEVYSYSSEAEIAEFWKAVWHSGFKYVAIRDMMISKSSYRQSDPLIVARVRQVFEKSKLDLWESLWGSLHDNVSLIHFLLSYHYADSAREFQENYLPLPVESLLPLVPSNYRPIYFEHFTLPYIQQKVEQEFDIQLQDRTHIKAIFKCQD